MAFRPRADLLKLGDAVPDDPVMLDANVLFNALSARGPMVLRDLLQNLSNAFVSGPTRAELAWVLGRLDPGHAGTARVMDRIEDLISRIPPARVLIPEDSDWLEAGQLAGRVARSLAGGGLSTATAFDRVELVSDALTAVLAQRMGLTIITEDADFDVLMRQLPGLQVLFYDRPAKQA